jgi:hypothetical protein
MDIIKDERAFGTINCTTGWFECLCTWLGTILNICQ